ncbi:NADH dehydrogenase [ubiquinone] 1 beta subcomplex subunit 5, mitochondrial-like [Chrysoperla carnea]|uniref:NADH dehydrogenase [ubiquinone] 1 beta subcomplex subunit 5, mitochondrial-like n=1 Tax=Chrysoperla carnea TaxID=189513 RepID=UPI001D076BE8|nr:NADH dehydrogenase [ubiquinone] 1 beta subcomplex subunit 5, mitochondrial-like [Chrysoperla carnea]
MFFQSLIKPYLKVFQHWRTMSRQCGHEPRLFVITPSRWQWLKTKDLWLYYMWIGFLVTGTIITGTNIFIGPAQLEKIPCGYVPRYWEYYQHPITRFLAQYIFPNPQQEYEKMMHYLYEEHEKIQIRNLEKKIRNLMNERHDYQAWYYRPGIAKYHRASKEAADYLLSLRGD